MSNTPDKNQEEDSYDIRDEYINTVDRDNTLYNIKPHPDIKSSVINISSNNNISILGSVESLQSLVKSQYTEILSLKYQLDKSQRLIHTLNRKNTQNKNTRIERALEIVERLKECEETSDKYNRDKYTRDKYTRDKYNRDKYKRDKYKRMIEALLSKKQ